MTKLDESWEEWGKEGISSTYDKWVPWAEDQILALWSGDNKASYAARQIANSMPKTGNKDLDKLQSDVQNLIPGLMGKGGPAQPVGDLVSKEVINRAERGGKDESGKYAPGPAGDVVGGVAGAASDAANEAANEAAKVEHSENVAHEAENVAHEAENVAHAAQNTAHEAEGEASNVAGQMSGAMNYLGSYVWGGENK
ncbi:hypothetical protein EJ06DRAFT_477515 [Trichodelitschia bisporula]|uniref:Uncharacterized protein n=1 Tax=Trichodelitschia bisporula TaxID=703511 RepID=A0A6G1HW98_9PEZI|nr:hypothetical protein EJ06DRAFT_477515 [Trichodelitschia bisporula]